MNITHNQGIGLIFLAICSGILIFMINNILILQKDMLIYLMGSLVTIFWLLTLSILSIRGLNNSLHHNFYGFLLILGLFHLGIPLGNFFGYSNTYYENGLSRWISNDYMVASYISVYFFILGYIITLLFKLKKSQIKDVNLTFNDFDIKISFYLYIFLILFWIIVVKIVANVSTYSEYSHVNNSSLFLNFVFVYGNSLIGMLYVLVSSNRKYSKKALYFLLLWGIFALPIGLRGEVIFPLMIGITFLVSQKIIKFYFAKAFILCGLVLTVLSAIFVYRHGEAVEGAEVNPLATLIEMGSSLRPLNESVKWIYNNEVYLFYGETYWAPFERLITKFIPYVDRMPASEDMRLMNVLIFEKAGPYGFSIIAEAFMNLSFLGCFIIGMVSGLFLKFFDAQKENTNFIFLCLIFALFFHIRQSFVGAFGAFLTFIILCILVKTVSYILASRKI